MKTRIFVILCVLLLAVGGATLFLFSASVTEAAAVPTSQPGAAGPYPPGPSVSSGPGVLFNPVPKSLPPPAAQSSLPSRKSSPPEFGAAVQTHPALAAGYEMTLASAVMQSNGAAMPEGLGGVSVSSAMLFNHDGIVVDLALERVWGVVDPGDTVTVTRTLDGAYGSATADGQGFFWTSLFDGEGGGYPVDLAPGDQIEMYVNGAFHALLEPVEITGGIDVLVDEVSGSIPAADAGDEVALAVGSWNWFPFGGGQVITTTLDSNLDFSTAFPRDLGAENLIAAEYSIGEGLYVRDYLFPDSPVFHLQQWSTIVGYAARYQNVHATVYASYPGEIRWEGDAGAGYPFGWYWIEGVEVEPGDYVELTFEDSSTTGMTAPDFGDLSFDVESNEVYGRAPEGSLVRANMYQWLGSQQVYVETFAVASSGDVFTATFDPPTEMRPRDWVDVVLTDDDGNQASLVSGPPFIMAQLDPFSEWDCVVGRVDGPGKEVTLSVEVDGVVYTRDSSIDPSDAGNQVGGGKACYLIWGDDWGPVDFPPGSVIALSTDTWEGSLEIPDITWQADTVNDRVNGTAPADGQFEVSVYRFQYDQYPANAGSVQLVDSDTNFSIDFSDYDLRDGDSLTLLYLDPVTGFGVKPTGLDHYPVQFLQVNVPHGIWGAVSVPGEQVTATLYDESGVELASTDMDEDPHPLYFWLSDFGGHALETSAWITVTGSAGWVAGLQIPDYTVEAGQEANLIYGEAPKSLLWIEGGREGSGFGFYTPVDGYALNPDFLGHTMETGDWFGVNFIDLSGNRVQRQYRLGELFRVEIFMQPGGRTDLWGEAQPGSTVTVTTAYGEATSYADPACGGCFDTYLGLLEPGDWIQVAAGEGLDPIYITVPDPFYAQVDADLNLVTGQVGDWTEEMLEIHGEWEDGYQEVMTDEAGSFAAGYDDIPAGARGYIRYVTSQGYTQVIYHRAFWPVHPGISVNYAHEWVNGEYEPGRSIRVTVRDDQDNTKAYADLTTGIIPWWGDNSGFETQPEDWYPTPPDISPGDRVEVVVDDLYSSSVIVGEITGSLDLAADTVSGTINAFWFTEPLHGNCGVWVENGPGMDFWVDPDGGAYECDFSGEWDLIAGQDVGVSYMEPDGDWVINVFRAPAPNLQIHTWGEGAPGVGSNFPFIVQFGNFGEAAADGVLISSVLEGGLEYLGDTSGVTPTGASTDVDPLVWDFGTLEANHRWVQFTIYARVTAGAGDTITHKTQIETSTVYQQWNDWELQSEWSGEVQAEVTNINISKWAWTGDPLPGYDFVYNVNICNTGPTSSAAVVMTDTLPLETTLVGWWGQYPGWQEAESDDHLLVVTHPTLSSGQCSEIYIRVLLDEEIDPEAQLYNTAEVASATDSTPDDNVADFWHGIGDPNNPYIDLAISKGWYWGQFVPGGQAYYEIWYRNQGNLPTEGVLITETLPAGASFVRSWYGDPSGEVDIAPLEVTADYVVWDIGDLPNGYGGGFAVALDLDPTLEPGTVIETRFEIGGQGQENNYDNNEITWSEILNGFGPNLNITKDYQWQGMESIWYEIRVKNFGSEPLSGICVADSYPEGLTFVEGEWGGHGPWDFIDNDAENRQLEICLDEFHPAETASIGFRFELDAESVGVGGLSFTNYAEAPLEGDINPEDNSTEATAYTGPDIFIEAWLKEGESRPGNVVTATVHFGNQNRWPWNGDESMGSHITATLPAGLEFISAIAPWDPGQTWDPETNQDGVLSWGWGTMWAESSSEFDIVLSIDENVQGGDILTVLFEAFGDNPDDIDPVPDNNTAELSLTAIKPRFQVGKAYQGGRVAGMPVTYTLAVSNIGTETGTNLELSDVVPSGVTYVGGGAYSAGSVGWIISSLAPGAQAEVQFWGNLACTPGSTVTNSVYRVDNSDQGVASDDGAAVSFTILQPAISAGITPSVLQAYPGETIGFAGAAITNGTPVTYAWNFGDQAAAAGQAASHAYAETGSYNVTLTVTDECGFTAVQQVTIQVQPRSLFLPLLIK